MGNSNSKIVKDFTSPKPKKQSATTTNTASAVTTNTASTTITTTATNATATPVYGLLPCHKTITIAFAPDWNQEELKSPLRAASICVVLGPANTQPKQARWSFES